MSLKESFKILLNAYIEAKHAPLAGHSFGQLMRTTIPKILNDIILDKRYVIKGSVGQGVWADAPWIAILDTLVTESVREGYYPVYIISSDCSGIYLTLNQGVTVVKEYYRSKTPYALQIKAKDYQAQLGALSEGYIIGPISLKARKGLPKLYESASIIAKYYPRDNIPEDAFLRKDLLEILNIYNYLSSSDNYLSSSVASDEAFNRESKYFENPGLVRLHKRIERNIRLIKVVKKFHGTICEACSIDMKDTYGAIGDGYIEAHHLKPLSTFDEKIQMDPKTDFAVLCPNCHAMIHKSPYIDDIYSFKKLINKSKK